MHVITVDFEMIYMHRLTGPQLHKFVMSNEYQDGRKLIRIL